MDGTRVVRLLVGIGFTVAGLALGWYVLYVFRGNSGARNWAQTRGQIVHSEIKASVLRPGQGLDEQRYTADVRYRYELHGMEFTSDRIAFGWNSAQTRRIAGKYVKRYPKGRAVTVYYDPANPTSAVLERAIPRQFYVTAGAAGIFLFFGIGALYSFVKDLITGE